MQVGGLMEGRAEPMTICGLARARKPDINRCYDAIRLAPRHRIHTFLATSDIHLEVFSHPLFSSGFFK